MAKSTITEEDKAKIFNNFLSLINFTRNRLITVPMVRLPQNAEITSTPSTSGSKEWYWYKNWDDQLLIPCSIPT